MQDIDKLDFLSFSPSLIDILCFVDQKDILICKLVSRHLNEVIQKNVKCLPRLEAGLNISFSNSETEGKVVIIELSYTEASERKYEKCCLSEQGPIEFVNSPRLLRLLGSSDVNKDGELKDNRQNTNIFTELGTALEIIIRRYCFSYIHIKNLDTPHQDQEEFCSVISDVLRAPCSKCRNLSVEAIAWRDVQTLYSKLDSQNLFLKHLNDLNNELSSFSTRKHCKIFVETTTVVNWSLICDMVKKWETCEFRAKMLEITGKDQYESRARELYHHLSSKTWFDTTCLVLKDGMCKMTFKRSMDDRKLCLTYIANMMTAFREYFHFSEL